MTVGTGRRAAGSVIAAAFALCLVIYLPDIGRGFLRDDFMWLRVSRIEAPADVVRIFTTNVGFYRPMVTLSFAVDQWLFGARPYAMALVNVALLFATAIALSSVARAMRLPALVGALAAALWILNVHGVNMALLWLSGRTALLLALFGMLAVRAAVVGNTATAVLCFAIALFAKEEAVTLPPVMLIARAAVHGWDRRHAARFLSLCAAVAIVYAALRLQSGAFGWSSAPTYYAFSTSPPILARNLLEYLDRGATFAAAWTLAAAIAIRRAPAFDGHRRRCLAACAAWFVLGYAVTVFLPVRSSLYALMPAAGASLAAGITIDALIGQRPAHGRRLAIGGLIALLLLIPVYRTRNQRWIAPATLATRLLADLQRDAATWPRDATVLVEDDRAGTIDDAFGALLPDAVHVLLRNDVTVRIGRRSAAPDAAVYRVVNGHLVRGVPRR